MTDEMMRALIRLQRYADSVHEVLVRAQDQAPQSSEGTDRSHAVRAFLDPDGLPKSFRVESGWNRTLAAEDFASAVLESCDAAMGERLATWTRALKKQHWQDQVEQLRNDLARPSNQIAAEEDRPLFRREPARISERRPVDRIAEDVITALDHASDFSSPASQNSTVTGADSRNRVSLTLSYAGLLSCNADSSWVSMQTGTTLTNALAEALNIARDALGQQMKQSRINGLDQLFSETLDLLREPRQILGF